MKTLLATMLVFFLVGCGGDGSLPPGFPVTECTDRIDNDGDGLIDRADPGCTSFRDDDESDDNPAPPPPDPDPDPDPPPPPPQEGNETIFLDLTHVPVNGYLRVIGLDLPLNAEVKVNGFPQTVLRQTASDGSIGTRPLPEHPGLVQAGLTATWENEFYSLIEVQLTNVVPGPGTLSIDGITEELHFTVSEGAAIEVNGQAEFAAAQYGPGDVVYFREGTYDSVVVTDSLTGELGNPIGFSAFPGELVVVTGTVGARQSAGHANFAGLTRVGGPIELVSPGAVNKGIRFVYNDVSGGSAIANCVSIKQGQDIDVLGNYLHDAGSAGSNLSECLYVQGHGVNTDIVLQHNHIENFAGKGNIFAFGHSAGETLDHLNISYNYVHNTAGGTNPTGIFLSGSDSQGDDGTWILAATIVGNTIESFNAGITLSQPCPTRAESLMVTRMDDNVLRNNGVDLQVLNVAPGSTAKGNATEDGFAGGSCNGQSFPVSPNMEVQ